MKAKPSDLTQEELQEAVSYCPETGEFHRKYRQEFSKRHNARQDFARIV